MIDEPLTPGMVRKMIENLQAMGVTPTERGYLLYCNPRLELGMTDDELAELGAFRVRTPQ